MDTKSISVLIDSTPSKLQQLQKAFTELKSHRAVTLNFKWQELESHFHGLEKSLKRLFHEVEDQEKVYESKTMKAQEILEEHKTVVEAKEEASLERLQEKRDAAVFAIAIARDKQRNISCEEYSLINSETQGGSIMEEMMPTNSMVSELTSENINGTVEDEAPEVQSAEKVIEEALSYPELVKLCKEMDSKGLHSFISDNRKNLASMREEIPQALKASANPACLVLNSLSNFYYADVSNMDPKKDSNLLGLRRTCIMLMECLSLLLMSLDSDTVANIISKEIKERAKAIAQEWKPKLNELDMEAGSGNSLEAHAFLQLLDTFAVASDFDVEELIKLVPLVSRRRQAADLCRSLGLSDKMPGVIEVLINSGRQIDAVNLAFQFDMTDKFPPVPLLQSHLNDAKKVTPPAKPGSVSPSASNTQNTDVNECELGALKSVIKCIEEHKLEQQFPIDSLAKRVTVLLKAKADKKRATEVTKPQSKRPKATNVGYVQPRITNIAPNNSPYAPARPTDRYIPQYVFDNRPYMYTAGPPDAHRQPIMAPPAYVFPPPPGHGNYYTTGYQYHQGPAYLH